MLHRSKIRTRVVVLPLFSAVVLGVIVGFDVHRSPATIVAAVAVSVLGVGAALAVARSITRPLRDLAAIARDLHELQVVDGAAQPRDDILAPRDSNVGGELASLAIAIADGRRSAAEFVHEQRTARRSVTDLIANLALRNERLLGAALDALGDISRRDHEPSTAAAIARVHRIVARVDRSTASALVLIGEGGRVCAQRSTITDIVWAAALAVESSDRVDALALPALNVHADAVADVAHLLAELIDNAVQASSPPGRVTIMGTACTDGGFELTIIDAGTGMATGDLATANRRVRRLESLHRVPTRNVGLDVVGRLARRHGIQARLGASAAGGVVVRVQLPAAILTRPATTAESFHLDDLDVIDPVTPAAAGASGARFAPEEVDLTIRDLAFEAETRVSAVTHDSMAASTVHPSQTSASEVRLTLVAPMAVVHDGPQSLDTTDATVLPALTPWSVEAPDSLSGRPSRTPSVPSLPALGRGARLGAADEFLPKRDQRKWAAAIARARS